MTCKGFLVSHLVLTSSYEQRCLAFSIEGPVSDICHRDNTTQYYVSELLVSGTTYGRTQSRLLSLMGFFPLENLGLAMSVRLCRK